MANTLQRYNRIRVADNISDQSDSASILRAPTGPDTQEDLQRLFLSRLRQIIYGEDGSQHWFEDLFAEGILSLKELSLLNGSALRSRVGVLLMGDQDGFNRTFKVPGFDTFVHDLAVSGKTIEVFHNGRLLTQVPPTADPTPENGDYTVEEGGGPGSGFDTINLLTFAPVRRSRLSANYFRI